MAHAGERGRGRRDSWLRGEPGPPQEAPAVLARCRRGGDHCRPTGRVARRRPRTDPPKCPVAAARRAIGRLRLGLPAHRALAFTRHRSAGGARRAVDCARRPGSVRLGLRVRPAGGIARNRLGDRGNPACWRRRRGVVALPVRYLGRIAYGLYLYHAPIYALGEQYRIHTALHLFTPALAVPILVLSIVSYEFVEKPILGLKGRFQRATTAPEGEGLRTV